MDSEIVSIIVENLTSIAATLLVTLIGVLGTWLTAKIGQHRHLGNLSIAVREVSEAAQLTVVELQQQFVMGWKRSHEDGKLTKDEIETLNKELLARTEAKLGKPVKKLLASASVDINEIIKAAGEAYILKYLPHDIKNSPAHGETPLTGIPTCF